jgi:hypothetical protein
MDLEADRFGVVGCLTPPILCAAALCRYTPVTRIFDISNNDLYGEHGQRFEPVFADSVWCFEQQ